METNKKFFEFIKVLNKRPGLFRVNKVEDISFIYLGFVEALENEKREALQNAMQSFQKYVNEHFESGKDFPWDSLIRLYAGGDSASLDLFAILINKFLEKH